VSHFANALANASDVESSAFLDLAPSCESIEQATAVGVIELPLKLDAVAGPI
jgi:hypothetical protein